MQLTETQERWLKELETTDKAQGEVWLKRKENETVYYCCLGIAAEMLEIEDDYIETAWKGDGFWSFNGEDSCLLDYEQLGLRTEFGDFKKSAYVDGKEYKSLTDMNDNGISFKEIAKFCRENPEVVFVNSEAV